ncbi:TPA: hypothetical protein ACH6AG_000169 [Campylobacter jejuni]
MTNNSLVGANIIKFGNVAGGPMTIVNPEGRDIIMKCYGQNTVYQGHESSGEYNTYYNSFSSTGTWLIGDIFYLKPGQTVTAHQNNTAMDPLAFYLTPK